MTDEMRKSYALMRYGIIAPVVCHMIPEGKTKKEFLEEASDKFYTNPDGKVVRFTAKTLERWCYFYEKSGFDALLKQPRRDKGKPRKINADIYEQIRYLKESYPRMPATEIHKRLVENGTITPEGISLSTVTRCVNQIVLERDLPVYADMRRYERPHINEVWCGDTCVGPKITMDGGKRRIYVLALIDDASRYITGAMVFYQDNFNSLLQVMKSAVSKYGVPKVWNFDNGGSFKNRQMELLAARIGSTVHYCHPYTPTQKSKIERWFRTLRDKWLAITNLAEFSSLSAIQESLDHFVDEYNHTVHSSLNGQTPDARFFSEPECIRRLNTDEIEKNFLLEVDRRVSPDCVITIDNVEYEVESRYARKRVKLRYTADMKTIYLVEDNNVYTPIRLLSKQENALVKRNKIYLSGGES
jgi:transposase InsO family protein